MNCVIGSGPAGVAAAAALIAAGQPVTMLDAGGELEPDVRASVDALSRHDPDRWTAGERDRVKGPLRLNAEGAPLKLAFGSDYMYRDVDALLPVVAEGVDAYRAVAAGGLSVVWGGAILPYSDADFEGWPIDASAMSPYYAAALDLTGLAAEHDDLARLYPLHAAPTSHVDVSSQARFVEQRMARHAAELARQHIYFGRARLAIGAQRTGARTSCVHCGMCLYGCPYGLIYSAEMTLKTRLAASSRFTYRPGFVVRSLKEESGGVTIEGIARETARPQRFEASRVYLAAGVLASTSILLESLQAYAQPLELMQSDQFLLPLVLPRAAAHPSRERLHTLSQMFVEIRDPAISSRGLHLQLYTYNDLYQRMAKRALGPLYALVAPAAERFIDRVIVVKGYLHSRDSAGIRAVLERRGDRPVLRLSAVSGRRSQASIHAVARLLRRNSKRIGAWPIPFALRTGLPGSAVHVGGSFPMHRNPIGLQSDLLGRPTGFTRVHVVDASVFPSVPAAPPTLTIMANAYRIAANSHAAQEAAP